MITIGTIVRLYLIFGIITAFCFTWNNQKEKLDFWKTIVFVIALLLPPLYWILYYLDGDE